MTTGRNWAFLEKGVTNWKFDITKSNGIFLSKEMPLMVKVKANWYTAQEALEQGIKVVSGNSANVLASWGHY